MLHACERRDTEGRNTILQKKKRWCGVRLRGQKDEEEHSAQLNGHTLVEVLRGSTSLATKGKRLVGQMLEDDLSAG